MSHAQQLALWADQLRDISARGLWFVQNIYDRENYQQIQDLALTMLALATNQPPDHLEPLHAPIFSRPAPIPTGDAAIIDETGRILLIQRADNRLWAMPRGALAVTETPAEEVVREAFEETGIRCEAVALVGVYDLHLCGTVSRHHLYQFFFLCRPLELRQTKQSASHAHEVVDQAWFTVKLRTGLHHLIRHCGIDIRRRLNHR